MKRLDRPEIDRFRVRSRDIEQRYGWFGDHTCGAFVVPSCLDKRPMKVIAASAGGWDHVSVSRENRVPNWYEMEQVKRLFFEDHEVAFQFHAPVTEHISVHPNCLHLWAPLDFHIPHPLKDFV